MRTLLRVRRTGLFEKAPELLRERILDGLDKIDRERRRFRRRLLWAFSCAAAAVLLSFGTGRFLTGGGTDARSVMVETVDEHIRCLLNAHPAMDFSTSDPAALTEWFLGKLDVRVTLPDLSSAGFHLQGARLCYLLDRRVAYLSYERDGSMCSLFVMAASGLKLPQAPTLSAGQVEICVQRRKGYDLALWESGGLLFSLVGAVDGESLARALSSEPVG